MEAAELSAEVEFLKQFVSRSRQRICKVARRIGNMAEQEKLVGICRDVTKLLNLLDNILSFPLTNFSTVGLQTTISNKSRNASTNNDGDQGPVDGRVRVNEKMCPSPKGEDDDQFYSADEGDEFYSADEGDEFYSADEDDVRIIGQPDKSNPRNSETNLNSGAKSADTLSSKNMDRKRGKKFECTKCSKTFKLQKYLNRHVVTHDSDAKVKCEICGKILNHRFALGVHMRSVHTNRGKRPSCDICRRVFFSASKLRAHFKTVHSKKKRSHFPCRFPHCEKIYLSKGSVSRHVKIEHVQNPVRLLCTLCGKEFKMKSALESHIFVHTTEKPYKCTTCGKEFAQKHSLKRHEMTHLDESNRDIFKCSLCPRTFLSGLDLQNHIQASHEKQKKFSTSWDLKSHVGESHSNTSSEDGRRHAEANQECYFCGEKFVAFEELVNHCSRIHTLEK